MSLTCTFSRLLVLLTFAIPGPAASAAEDHTEPGRQLVTAKIKLDERSMIIVPVSINGSRPYDFMLDTGCAKTIIDQKLADQLGLPRTAEKTVVGVLASTKMSVASVDSMSVAGAVVSGGEIFTTAHAPAVTGNVRGVLGEDFLRNFDLLIDYRHQIIELDSPLGSIAQTAIGEHLPLQLDGIYHGKPSRNRLIISGRIQEFGDATMSLLLDSGANQLTLFNLGSEVNQAEPVTVGNFNQWVASSATARRIRSLSMGNYSVPDLTVVTLSRHVDFDSDGLIPTSLFRSIFISSHGGFVILNPSFVNTSRDEQAGKAAR